MHVLSSLNEFEYTKGQTEIVKSEDRQDHGLQNGTKVNHKKTLH